MKTFNFLTLVNFTLVSSRYSVLLLTCILTGQMCAQVPDYVRTDGLKAWYSFSGNTEDSSTNSADLLNLGANPTTDRFLNANSAYNFTGDGPYMKAEGFIDLENNDDFAVSLWFKGNGSGVMTSYGLDEGGPWERVLMIYKHEGLASEVSGYWYDAASNAQIVDASYSATPSWHHVVFRRNGTVGRIYIDGIAAEEFDNNSYWLANENFYVGCQPDLDNYYDGDIDDIGVWFGFDANFSDCDVMKLYKSYTWTNPEDQIVGGGGTANFSVTNSSEVGFQWQVNQGTGWEDLSNAAQYSGVYTNTVTMSDVSESNNNFLFRCVIDYDGVCQDISDEATLIFDSSISVDELENALTVSIHPNPSSGAINISVQNLLTNGNSNLQILDNLGRVVYSDVLNNSQTNIDLGPEVQNGIYFFRVTQNGLSTTEQISILR